MSTRATRTNGRSSRDTGDGLTCREVRPLLSVLVDGEGDDLQRARIDRHLRRCRRCRDFEAFVRRQAAALRSEVGSTVTPEHRTPAASDLALEIRRVRGETRKPSWRSSMVATAMGAALSVGLLVGGLGAWTLSQDQVVDDGPRIEIQALPQVVALRTLDPEVFSEEVSSILTAWVLPRPLENTFDEKTMYWVTPMSHFERVHYRPEQL